MELMQAIKTRRSIRKFTDQPVSEETVQAILEAAMMAPSAGNAQPWRFLVVTDRALLDSVTQANPHAKMVASAPLGIMVCADLSLEKYPGFWVQDCSAAMQNLLLAAHDLGLGACWTGIHPWEDRIPAFKALFNMPENVVPLGFVPMGYPAQEVKSESRFKADRVHYNTF